MGWDSAFFWSYRRKPSLTRSDLEVVNKTTVFVTVVEERRGKQEAKKVLKELQNNYDTLLHKFAAAENALGRFY